MSEPNNALVKEVGPTRAHCFAEGMAKARVFEWHTLTAESGIDGEWPASVEVVS